MVFVSIVGLIAAGKTTAARGIAEQCKGARVLFENAQCSFIRSFYGDPRRFAMATQIFMLGARAEAHNQVDSEVVISDGCLLLDRAFAFCNAGAGNISARQLRLYIALFDEYNSVIKHPDYVLYIDVPPEVALERVRARAVKKHDKGVLASSNDADRPFEEEITLEYLVALRDALAFELGQMNKIYPHAKVVTVDGTKFYTGEELCAIIDDAMLEESD